MQRLLIRTEQNGRVDGIPEVVRHRLALYHRETAPLAAIYEAAGLLHRVDGVGAQDDVHTRLLALPLRTDQPAAAAPPTTR